MKNTKKLLGLILAVVLALSLLNTPALAADSDGSIAAPIEYTLSVDGKNVSLWAYKIGGGMYFKLRDLAMALSGTEKQFDISWTFDSGYMGIDLLSGRAYMSIGSELSAPSNPGDAVAVLSTASFHCDGRWPAMPAYLISGAHYVKLSDLAATLKFASDCNEGNHTAKIETSPEIIPAEPTGKAFDNIALTHARNSYFLDKDGNVILSYHNGVTTIQAPFKPGTEDFYSVYISDDKTAIAYGGGDKPFQVLISDDMGKTWNTYAIESARYLGANRYIGFITQEDGFLVASPGSSLGTSYNFVFETSDGGKTWTQIGNPNGLYPRNATGAGFSTKNIGFISYRVDDNPGPTIYRTMDGGYTWEKLEVTVPSEYDYNIPLSPVFSGANGVYPIEYHVHNDDGSDGIITYYLTSDDYGMTWTYDETYNLACQWAEAVKNRDGRAQYALLSSRQQKESYDGYVSFDWVTGASSPWVDDYTVKLTATGAVITYKWASSTGPDGVSVTTLTFVRENGALRIGSITGTQIEADAATASQTLPGQFFQKLESATDEKIISVQCDDFDDDGKREAFVMTGKGNLNEGGNLWFVSEDEVSKLNNMYLYSLPEMIQIGEQKFIKYEEEYATGRPLFLLDVENGKPKSVISGNAQDLTQMPDGTFTVQQNTLDMMRDGTGRTLKPYWLYYDNVFHEYGAIEITQAQLLEFAGANNILKQIEAEGGAVKSILYRNNHIININYQTDQGMNRYVNLKYNDTSVSVLQTDNGSGVYLAALLPDIATYPASFLHPTK